MVVEADDIVGSDEVAGVSGFSIGWLGVELGVELGFELGFELGLSLEEMLGVLLEAASLEVLLDAEGVYRLSVIISSSRVFFRLLSVSG